MMRWVTLRDRIGRCFDSCVLCEGVRLCGLPSIIYGVKAQRVGATPAEACSALPHTSGNSAQEMGHFKSELVRH
jgi:hypothetical protein